MISASMQGNVRHLILTRLRIAYQRVRLSTVSSLLVSLLVVVALWPAVARQGLAAWLFVLWPILAVRYLFARRFLKLDQSARVKPNKWIAGYVIGAAATGLCWGATVFCFPESPRDQTALLLVFVIAGVSAFASVTMASIPLASNAFMLSSLLPMALWLFSFDQYAMTLITLVYLGLMLLLSRQVHEAVLSSAVSNHQNKELTLADQERETRYRAQNKLLHSVMEGASDVSIWAIDRDCHYLMFNAAHRASSKKLRGVDIAIGMSAIDMLKREEFREFFDRGFGPASAGNGFAAETREEVVQDGSTTFEYFEHHGSRIYDDEGEVFGLTIFSHNITERKRMELELEDSRNFLSKVINSISDPISVKDSEHRWILLNDTCCAMIGHPREVLLGKSDYEFFPKEQADVFWEKDDLVYKSGQINVNEETLTDANGNTRYLLTQKSPFTFRDGQRYIVGISRDITERKAIEKAYRDSEHMLQEAQRIAHVGSWDVDMVNDKLTWSDEIFRIWEIDKTKFKADFVAFLETVHPQDRERVLQAYNEAVVNHSLYAVEHRLLFPDGRVKHILEQGEPQYDAQGKPVRFIGTSLDITERKRLQNELTEREREFRSLAENLPDNIARWDVDGRYLYVNPTHERTLGIAASDLMGKPLPDTHAHVRAAIAQVVATGQMVELVRQPVPVGDEIQFHEVSLVPEFDAEGRLVSVLGLGRNMTEFYLMQQAVVEREHESRTLIDNTPDTIARYNRDCIRIFANQALANGIEGGLNAALGKTPTEVPGGEQSKVYETKLREVLATGANTEFELVWPGKNGQALCSHIRLTAEFDTSGTVVTVLAVGRDITDLYNFRQKIHQMAFYDNLTSLPNRALFNDRLHQVLHDAEWHGQLAGVMLLDLDRFKAINDSLGHPAGDALLREAALRLTFCVRTYDTVARLGGDEFAILLPDIRSGADLGRVASKILTAFNEPFFLEGNEVFVSTSIGIAVYPNDDTDPHGLIKQADSAMYFAKRSGRNNFRFYSKDLTASATEKLSLESELRRALERNELELYYQPKIRLGDNMLVGSEALLRWNNPQRGIVPPNEFIAIAEDSGLIIDIGHWVLRDACRTACDWNGAEKPLHKVAINLSARQFQSNDLVSAVCNILEETGCQPQWIELEITESLLLDEQDQVLEMLKSFSDMGVTIAIDDFGTGYSSLSYLARFPINTLKIDRSFIGTITTEHFRGELVKAILSIARCLGQEVVAEGVETIEQASFLQAHGCQIAQGYLYGKPVPKVAFEAINFAKRGG